MKYLMVFGLVLGVIALVAGCSSPPKPAPDPGAEVPSAVAQGANEQPVIRLIGMGRHVEDIRLELGQLKKKFNPMEIRSLANILSLADDALATARSTYLLGNMESFERSISAIETTLQEFRSTVGMFENDRKMLEVERAYQRSQKKK